MAKLQATIKRFKAKVAGKTPKSAKILPIADVPGIVVDDAAATKIGEWQPSTHSGSYIGAGYVHDMNTGKGEKSLSFEPVLPATGKYEVLLAYSPGGSRSAAVPVTIFSAEGEKTIVVDMKPNPGIDGRFVSLGKYRFEKDGQSYVTIATEGTTGHVTADAVTFIPEGAKVVGSKVLDKKKNNQKLTAVAEELAIAQAALDKLQKTAPQRPMVMSVVERPKIEDGHILVRGVVHNEGPVVPRGFLQVATLGDVPDIPAGQSGRKELAEWVTDPDNPLTARVYVNRVWHWLTGSGIVRTVDNFGTTGERPSDPALLDHLAGEFTKDGWSTKKLVRQIVLSRTYRQSSTGVATDLLEADPENRLLRSSRTTTARRGTASR